MTFRLLMLVSILISATGGRAAAEEWQVAVDQANAKITDYQRARSSGDPAAIREATVRLQEDPLAIRLVNRNSPEGFKTQLNQDIGAVQVRTRQLIRERLAERGIAPERVTFFEATNPPKPGDPVKVGQDWDLTVRVDGRDLPAKVSQPIAHESYYEAATGKKPPPVADATARSEYRRAANRFAEQQSLAATNYQHPESYGGGPKEGGQIIGGSRDARLRDAGQLTKVIDYKSAEARNLAAELRAEGRLGSAVGRELEELRQSTKQFDKQVAPRVRELGGKVPEFISKGQDIMQQVDAGKLTPEQARARLAEMGETPESLIRKTSELVEATQVLQRPSQRGEPAPDVFVENVRERLQSRQLVRILDRVEAGELTAAQAREQIGQLKEINLDAIRKPRGNLTGQKPLTEGKSSFAPIEGGPLSTARTTANNALGALWAASTAGEAAAHEGRRAAEAGEEPSRLRAAGNAMLEATLLPGILRSGERGHQIGQEELAAAQREGSSKTDAFLSGMGRVAGDFTGWTLGSRIAQEEIEAEERRAVQEGREPDYTQSAWDGAVSGLGEVLMINSIARAANSVTEEEVIFVGQEQVLRAWAQGKLNENYKELNGIQVDLQEALARRGATGSTVDPQYEELRTRYDRARQTMTRLAGAMQRQLGEDDPLVAAVNGRLSQFPDPPPIPGDTVNRPTASALAEGLQNSPVAPPDSGQRVGLDRLSEGLKNATARTTPPKERTTAPKEPTDPKERTTGPKERTGDTPRPTPTPITPAPEDQPLYAVYGVHFYPAQPRGASPAELSAWKARVTSERTFTPQERPQGYLAFRIEGEVLQQYQAHQRKLAAGETRDEFELFRIDGHFSQRAVLRAGAVRLEMPLFLTFFRLERKEPTWVTRTTVGFAAGQDLGNRIQTMSSASSAGSWTATVAAQKVTFGALHYEGLEGWGAESRRHGSKTMQFLISIAEGIGEAIGGRQ